MTEMDFQFYNKGENLLFLSGKKFQSKQTFKVSRKINTVPKATILIKKNNTFVSPIFTFSLAGNIIVQTPIQATNREKSLNHII